MRKMIQQGDYIYKEDPRIKSWDEVIQPCDNECLVTGVDYYSRLIFGVISESHFNKETEIYVTETEDV